jgi:hypothetical protein
LWKNNGRSPDLEVIVVDQKMPDFEVVAVPEIDEQRYEEDIDQKMAPMDSSGDLQDVSFGIDTDNEKNSKSRQKSLDLMNQQTQTGTWIFKLNDDN